MQMQRLELEMPVALSNFVDLESNATKTRITMLFLIDLVQQEVISCGKAAELAGIDKMTFITNMGKMGIPYFNQTIEEVMTDVKTSQRARKELQV